MNNTTDAVDTNSTDVPYRWQSVHAISYIVALFGTIWTIIANLFILSCFFRSRKRPWTSFSRQTCSMTVSDILVGIICVPLLVFEQNDGQANSVVCASTFYMFFAIQCVTLYHVLGICIYRNLNLKKYTDPSVITGSSKYINSVIIASWSLALAVILVPFLIWTDIPQGLMFCNIEMIFGTHDQQAMLYIGLAFLIPQCLTNLLYLITSTRLWFVVRRIVPVQTVHPGAAATSVVASTSTGQTTSNSSRNQTTVTNIGNVCSVPFADTSPVAPSQPLVSTVRSQKRVIGTIGILLMMFNLFTLPVTAGLFVEKSQNMNRNVRFILVTLFVLNSGFNPIVYATRITLLRRAIKEIIREITNVCCF